MTLPNHTSTLASTFSVHILSFASGSSSPIKPLISVLRLLIPFRPRQCCRSFPTRYPKIGKPCFQIVTIANFVHPALGNEIEAPTRRMRNEASITRAAGSLTGFPGIRGLAREPRQVPRTPKVSPTAPTPE